MIFFSKYTKLFLLVRTFCIDIYFKIIHTYIKIFTCSQHVVVSLSIRLDRFSQKKPPIECNDIFLITRWQSCNFIYFRYVCFSFCSTTAVGKSLTFKRSNRNRRRRFLLFTLIIHNVKNKHINNIYIFYIFLVCRIKKEKNQYNTLILFCSYLGFKNSRHLYQVKR